MANEPEFSKTGVWFDRKAGKVVKSRPVHGIQFVAPGGELTKERKAAIEAAERASKGAVVVEKATAPAAVETATVKAPAAKSTRKG